LNPLTSRELMLLDDHIKMEANIAKCFGHFSNEIQDQQMKTMCQQMAQHHQQHIQMLSRHISQQTLQ
jgi:hypothetical protein